jgi:hypothetical protein
LAETRRVLKPGGALRFIEHVRGEGMAGRLHDLVAPLWSRLMGGCHPNRRTVETIQAMGLSLEATEEQYLPAGVPLVAGTARA